MTTGEPNCVNDGVEPLGVAKILKALVEREGVALVILGKQAIDDDSNQTGQMLASLLGWGQATFASKIDLGDDKITVTREVDGGVVAVNLHGHHGHGFALRGIHLAGHDGRARLVFGDANFGESAARAGRHPANIV